MSAGRRIPAENRPLRTRSASPRTQPSRLATAEPRGRAAREAAGDLSAGRGRRASSLAEAAQGERVFCLSWQGLSPGPETRGGFDRMPLLPPKDSLFAATEDSSRGLPSLPSAHPLQPGHPLCPPTCLSSLGPCRPPRVSGSLPRSQPQRPFLPAHPVPFFTATQLGSAAKTDPTAGRGSAHHHSS